MIKPSSPYKLRSSILQLHTCKPCSTLRYLHSVLHHRNGHAIAALLQETELTHSGAVPQYGNDVEQGTRTSPSTIHDIWRCVFRLIVLSSIRVASDALEASGWRQSGRIYQSVKEIKAFLPTFDENYSTLADVHGVADGWRPYLEQSGNNVFKKMFYNGWREDH